MPRGVAVRVNLAVPLLALLLPAAWPAVASTQAPVARGARVRLHTSTLGGPLTGTVLAAETDTLIVRVEGEGAGLIVPLQSVERLEVGRVRTRALEGLGGGALVGALLGFTASPYAEDEEGEPCGSWAVFSCLAYRISPNAGTRAAVLGLAGAVIGVAIGSNTRVETWRAVRLERVAMGPGPEGRGVTMGVSLSF